MSKPEERYLVLCVDRDDDLGTKAKVDSPVVGKDEVLTAATKLALADPEEADANAIFAAVRKYDELKEQGNFCEVAVVCGAENRGFEADRRVGKEVAKVLEGGQFTGVVLVSDGADDELVIPIIQSLKPIVSVQRVTVKHSQTVEETYQVLGRYLRMLVWDPRYSRWSLGVPGLILLLAGILIIANQVFEAELATLLILGGAFLIRGFSVDRTVAELLQRGRTGYIRLFSMVVGGLVVIAGLITGYIGVQDGAPILIKEVQANPANLLNYGATLLGYMIRGSLALVFGGLAVYEAGALLSHVARDSVRWRRDGYVIVMLLILFFPIRTFSDFLINGAAQSTFLLISAALIGLAAIFALTTAIYPRVRPKSAAESD